MSAGPDFTCGLTPTGAAYCWGDNSYGELGSGTLGGPEQCYHACAPTAVPVAGGLRFTSISAAHAGAYDVACGVTEMQAAYCWGDNLYGELGIGTTVGPTICSSPELQDSPCSTSPVPVSGGVSFAAVRVGQLYACGLTPAGAAYCWGHNDGGQLGNGTTTDATAPVAVAGGLTFAALTAGAVFACGITAQGAAYCWGRNDQNEIGTGSTAGPDRCPIPGGGDLACSKVPVAVSGGLTFRSVAAARTNACAVTTAGSAYCWGNGVPGGPVLVNGSLQWSTIDASEAAVCGVLQTGAAYCWGSLGDVSNSTPTAVVGGRTFTEVSVGSRAGGTGSACGVTPARTAYCWGVNEYGQLGDGTKISRAAPVVVINPEP